MVTIFDGETTTKNKGHVYTPENFLVSYSYKTAEEKVAFKYYTDPDFITRIREVIADTTLIVGFNLKFDIQWLRRVGVQLPNNCRVFDCQLADFILSGQTRSFASLDDCLEQHGLPKKQDKVKEYWALGIDTPDIPVEILQDYGDTDVLNTYLLYKKQLGLLTPKQHRLVLLEGLDLLALAEAEWNGMKFDLEKCKEEIEKYSEILVNLQKELDVHLPPGIPPQCGFNWDSGDQLSAFLYGGEIKYEYPIPVKTVYKSGPSKGLSYTKNRWEAQVVAFPARFNALPGTEVKKTAGDPTARTRFYQVDDPTLRQLKSRSSENQSILKALESRAKATKVKEMMESMLKMFEKYGWDQFVHGQFNQNVARTGRLSSSGPNLQNTPPELDQLIISRYE